MLDGMEVHVHRQVPGELLVSRGAVLVRYLDGGATTIEDVDFACGVFDRMLEQHRAIAVMVVVEHGTPLPPVSVGNYTAERFGAYTNRVVFGVCMLGLGFWAGAAHTTMTLMMRILGKSTIVLDTNLEAAASRMALEFVGLDAQELVAFCKQLRSQRATVQSD
jgi:hypothetical protein